MYIIVGLGNIGREYDGTRHNIGFAVLDELAHTLGVSGGKEGFHSTYIETRYNNERIVLAKPTTFMNNSGFAVRDLINWYKCEHDQLIVVYDDIELPTGDIRIREKGSAGTHNGMRSIIYQLGFDDFPRVRVGIGKQKDGRDLIAHVLGKPDDEDKKLLKQSVDDAKAALIMLIEGDMHGAQTHYNKKKSGSNVHDIENKQTD